MNIETELLQLS